MKQLRVNTEAMSIVRRGISDETVKEVRDLRAKGWANRALAEKFGIHKNTITDICSRKTYKDVP